MKTKMTKQHLEPCPFCGNENILVDECPSTMFDTAFYVVCVLSVDGGCGTQTDIFESPKLAIGIWNTRTPKK